MYPFNPFAPPVEADVRKFVGDAVMMLAQTYHVEVRWNVPGPVIVPNGEFMCGIPGTQLRLYRILTLPTWITSAGLAQDTDSVLQQQYDASQSWKRRVRGWFSGSSSKLTVPGPVGAFEVKEFSVPN